MVAQTYGCLDLRVDARGNITTPVCVRVYYSSICVLDIASKLMVGLYHQANSRHGVGRDVETAPNTPSASRNAFCNGPVQRGVFGN